MRRAALGLVLIPLIVSLCRAVSAADLAWDYDVPMRLPDPYVSTGSLLLDVYCEALQDELWGRPLYEFAANNVCPATLSNEQLEQLIIEHPEYGGQPEYWQLRAWCLLRREWFEPETPFPFEFDENMNLVPLPVPEDLTPDPRRKAVEYLEKAAALESGTADSLCLAYKLRRELWNEELDASVDAAQDAPAGPGESSIELMARLEQQEQAYLQRCIDAAPQMAWPYLQRARYWSEYGELELCEVDLKAAASATDQHCPQFFPISLLFQRLEAGETLINAFYDGLLIEAFQHSQTESPVALLGPLSSNFMVAFNLDGDVRRFSSYHRAACAVGLAPRGGLYCPSAALVSIARPARDMLLYAPELFDSRQRVLLFNLQSYSEQYVRQLRGPAGPLLAELHEDSDLKGQWEAPESWDYFPVLHQRHSEAQQKVARYILPYLRQVQDLDYQNINTETDLAAGLEWPPAW